MSDIAPENLAALASRVEKRLVQVPMSDDEIYEAQSMITELLTIQRRDDEEFSEIRKNFSELKKMRTKRVMELVDASKSGFIDKEIVCYDVPDHATDMMRTYDPDGKMLTERRMRPSERQITMIDKKQLGESNERR